MDFEIIPIENITFSQKQGRLFEDKLSIKLNLKNKLYKLRDLVNWSELELCNAPRY
jgi:hypothetical protein